MPQGEATIPHEPAPQWRATLQRVLASSWLSDPSMRLGDEALAQNVRLEFERPSSALFGNKPVSARVRVEGNDAFFRVVLSAPDGKVVVRDAPTHAEALGRALTEHLQRRRT